jgi:hypothetical protein
MSTGGTTGEYGASSSRTSRIGAVASGVYVGKSLKFFLFADACVPRIPLVLCGCAMDGVGVATKRATSTKNAVRFDIGIAPIGKWKEKDVSSGVPDQKKASMNNVALSRKRLKDPT